MKNFSCFACIFEFPMKVSILSIHTEGEVNFYPPPYAKNNVRRLRRQVWAKCGPNLLNILDLPGGVGGGGVRI